MGIPGRSFDRVETRAKVRIGVKKTAQSGKKYPAAVDYFVCDDPEFPAGQPKTLRITFPFATAADNFSTGLERWLSKKGGDGQVLTCYTKDAGRDPIALRLTDFVQPGDTTRGEARGQRTPITCTADACPFLKDKSCKPMGRLQFFLEGGRQDEALQLDTKAWNTIEEVSSGLLAAERRNPDLRGRVFELSVAFRQKGTDRFPVVSIKEAEVPLNPNSEADVNLAELMLRADAALSAADPDVMRVELAGLLDAIRPGWRDEQDYIARIKEVGVETALKGTVIRVAEMLA